MGLAAMLQQDAKAVYRATEGLFRMVDDLDWKPATGHNWMTTVPLLMHCTDACGAGVKGFLTGQWPTPADAGDASGETAMRSTWSPPLAFCRTASAKVFFRLPPQNAACLFYAPTAVDTLPTKQRKGGT